MKLLWDAVGTEFGGRHELYERNLRGRARDRAPHRVANGAGQRPGRPVQGIRRAVHGEYTWTDGPAPDLITPEDINLFLKKRREEL